MTVEGDDAGGYRVRMQSPFGGTSQGQGLRMNLLLVREEGKMRVLDTTGSPTTVGLEVLEQAEKGALASARRLLDWVREDVQLAGGEDPLAGPAFPRLWTRGAEASRDEIRVAAASIVVRGELGRRVIPILQQAREDATSDSARLNLDLSLAESFAKDERHTDLLPVAERLLASHPRSLTAFNYVTVALIGSKKWAECERVAQERLKLVPDDPDAIRTLANNAAWQGRIAEAQRTHQRLVELGKAQAEDYNGIAWNALVLGAVTQEAIQSAQRATTMTQNASFPSLHTLASLYAEVAKTSEARAVLLQAMDVQGLDEPDSESWYVFGRIAEQFGEKEAALFAYRKVEKPEKEVHALSTYLLAQRRITALGR